MAVNQRPGRGGNMQGNLNLSRRGSGPAKTVAFLTLDWTSSSIIRFTQNFVTLIQNQEKLSSFTLSNYVRMNSKRKALHSSAI